MSTDLTLPVGSGGYLNLRVGAVIRRNGLLLMAGNPGEDYLYSVGGRMHFGETADEAIVREVYEETGCRMEIDRLGFIHETMFRSPFHKDAIVQEISFYYYMKVPADFEPVCKSCAGTGQPEFLRWVAPDAPEQLYPVFFRDLKDPLPAGIQHIVTNETAKQEVQA